MKNMKRILMASLAVLGLGIGLVGMTQFVGTTTASASVKKLSLKQAVKLTNHYDLFNISKLNKLKLNRHGKFTKSNNYVADAKRYKKGWKLTYVGLVGGYRATLKLVPKGNKKVVTTRTSREAYEPGTTTKHRTIARKLPKKVWHKGFPKFLRHKSFYANMYSKKGVSGYYFFAFRKTALTEGLGQAGDTGLSGVHYKKRGTNYYLKGKIEAPGLMKVEKHTYKIHKTASKSFTATSLSTFRGKKVRTYHYAKHAPKINW